MSDTQTYESLVAAAAALGTDHGRAAGTWVIDGNTPDSHCAAILRMDEEGDPELWDSLPSSPLSGEWAGSMTPGTLLDLLLTGIPEKDRPPYVEDDICDAYEEAWYDAIHDQVILEASQRLA